MISTAAFMSLMTPIGVVIVVSASTVPGLQRHQIGREVGVEHHLHDGEEFKLRASVLVERGKRLFEANWTEQDGAGRPLTKGSGTVLVDSRRPLKGLQAFNRVSGPDANSCAGCHRAPFNTAGGSGDIVSNAFEGAERFDYVTFDRRDTTRTRGSVDERGEPATLQTVGNSRLPPDLLGAGYLEALAIEMTRELRRTRDSIAPGQTKPLSAKGISFGTLARRSDGSWNVDGIIGLPAQSVRLASPSVAPSLIVRPWGRSGTFVSIRELTNSSFNQHLGIQTTERFGIGTDPDGDGIPNEMTRADLTAVALFGATLPPPGRVIPNDPKIESSIETGERAFDRIGCASCHTSALPLTLKGATYSEPNSFNPRGNLRPGSIRALSIDLTNVSLPGPRLAAIGGGSIVYVKAYTDLKLHDVTDPKDETAKEPLDLNEPAGSAKFAAGNRKFLTRRLWAVGNEPPYWHDGRFTTLREAILAHAGEALDARNSFEGLAKSEQDGLIEFLKSLQALPPGTKSLVVDEHFQPRAWAPKGKDDTGVSQAGR